jgi:hypothetical protein
MLSKGLIQYVQNLHTLAIDAPRVCAMRHAP